MKEQKKPRFWASKKTVEFFETQKVQKQHQEELQARKNKIVEEFIGSVTNEEILEDFANYELRLRNSHPTPESLKDSQKEAYDKALSSLTQIKQMFFDIDRSTVDGTTAYELYEVLRGQIPNLVINFCSTAMKYSPAKAWNSFDHCRPNGTMAQDYHEISLTLERILRLQKNLNVVKSTLTKSKKNVNSFATDFSNVSSEITITVSRLEKLWKQASANSNAVEDEYFLEQVKSSYLPEAWELYKTVQFAPDDIRLQAQAVLLKQFNVIEKHILGILSKSMDQSIDAMKSQLLFLENKAVQPKTSSLDIKPTLKEVST